METDALLPRKLWTHAAPQTTPMWAFLQRVNKAHGLSLKTFGDLYAWSIAPGTRAQFWAQVFSAARFIHDGTADPSYADVLADGKAPIDAVPRWFPGVKLNFAENVLYSRQGDPRTRGTRDKEDAKVAVTEVREDGKEHHLTWAQLRTRTGRLAAAMHANGVREGDRIVVVAANSVETLLVCLATTWLGALFSSSSTDMGVAGILQRSVLVDPKFVFMDDAALYNGKVVDLREKMAEIVDGLASSCREFSRVVSIARFQDRPADVSRVARSQTLTDFLSAGTSAPDPPFVRVPFYAPFVVCYSSGTTGTPKAIVHSVGGCLLNSFKETVLHESIGPRSVVLQFTTTGWIMYMVGVSVLVYGARSVMYDGSPLHPDPGVLVRLAAKQRATKLGISPRWMSELAKRKLKPRDMADLSSLELVTSTGMPLSDQLFEWFYDEAFPARVQLANLSGGTDIAGCFGLQNPLTPVYVGGTQGPSLGVQIAIYDATLPDGPGREVSPPGEPGELVAVSPFPNMPVFFWADTHAPEKAQRGTVPAAPPGSRYHAAYFARFHGVWAHGDFCRVDPRTANVHFLGRADGVLNPSGVRFGSADIYAVLERHFHARVADALCVGQKRPGRDDDERVLLFLLMRPGENLDEQLTRDVKAAIASDLSKRHVPAHVFQTWEIPTTVNGKKVELPVKQIVSGHTVKPSGTLLNPGSLEFYYQFANLEDLVGKAKAKL